MAKQTVVNANNALAAISAKGDAAGVETSKVELTEAQKEQARSALVSMGIISPKLKKIRIPKRFEDISLHWVKNAPFFAEFMFRFHFYETNDIPTAGVNCIRGNINFYFNPQFIDGGGMTHKLDEDEKPVIKLNDKGDAILDDHGHVQYEMEERKALTFDELEGLIIHEIQHLIRLHVERTLDDPQLFNIAGDMLINNNIKELKIGSDNIKLPKGGVYLDQILNPKRAPGRPPVPPYKGEPVTEPVYIWLTDVRQQFQQKQQQLMQQQGKGQGGGGQGQGNGQGQGQQQDCPSCGGTGKDQNGNTCPDCNGTGKQPGQGNNQGQGQSSGDDLFDSLFGSRIDVHKVIAASDELAESTINEVIEAAKIRGWGNMSGNGTEELKELLKPARIPWKQLLRRAISPLIYDYGPYFENTWSRRNRRSLPLPGMRRLSNRLIVSIDTSGSIGHSELQQFFTEIEKIVKDFSQLIVIQWDTEIQAVEERYKRGDWRKIKIKGRGGTDVQGLFDYLQEHELTKYPIVNFTDGYFSMDYDTRGVQNIIWCVTSDVQPKGGKTIHCEITK